MLRQFNSYNWLLTWPFNEAIQLAPAQIFHFQLQQPTSFKFLTISAIFRLASNMVKHLNEYYEEEYISERYLSSRSKKILPVREAYGFEEDD